MKRIITILTLISCCIIMPAQQRFIYLTTDEVSIFPYRKTATTRYIMCHYFILNT